MNYCSFDFDLFNDPEKLGKFREHVRQIGEKHAEQRIECFKQKFSNQASIILDELNFDYRELLASWTINKTELSKVYIELQQLHEQQRINEIKELELEISNIGLNELKSLYVSKCIKLKRTEQDLEWLKKLNEQDRKIQALGG